VPEDEEAAELNGDEPYSEDLEESEGYEPEADEEEADEPEAAPVRRRTTRRQSPVARAGR
jgi:hypothetical protein